MIAIALSELRMLFRNRVVALSALAIPLGLGALLVWRGETVAGGASSAALLQILIMAGMGVYVTATTTLAARRQTLTLKRLRSGTSSDPAVLAGLLLPVVVVNVIQIGVVLVALAATSTAPGNTALVIGSVILTQLMLSGFALATAGVTTSPEHAQFTTLPVFLLVVGVGLWVSFTGLEELIWVKLALPGGAIAYLTTSGWNGTGGGEVVLAVAFAIAWTLVAAFVASRMFRWEPRR